MSLAGEGAAFGTRLLRPGEARFRLWAPAAAAVDLLLEGDVVPMRRAAEGWFETITPASAGMAYRFRIDGGDEVPDPASRFQPQDVEGPSELVDPDAFAWTDAAWRGRPWREAVIYELHVGAFTPEGTFAAIEPKLDEIAALGITAIELMPLADFPGRRNWGYDGVLPFAPDSTYGRPEDLKKLVQAAHSRGLMVLLDVVYNHFGPAGNLLARYAPDFFRRDRHTAWGPAIDFRNRWVRAFFVQNALHWLEEYRFDGLRLDAVHAIEDDSPRHILDEIAATVRGRITGREVHLVLENDDNAARWLGPGGYEAQWNDDAHHACHVLATGEVDGYYQAYAAAPAKQLARCLAEGFAYQGEVSPFSGKPRGEASAHLRPACFVNFLQNHDQVGNRAFGERLAALATPRALKALSAIVLLAPSPPLVFMGEEWGCRQPFLFFCDFAGELAEAVRNGRREEFARFAAFADAASRTRIPDPLAEETYAASKLRWNDRESHAGREWMAHYRELLAIRARAIAPRHFGPGRYRLLGERAFEVAWRGLLLQANCGEGRVPMEAPRSATALWALGEPGEPWSVQWWTGE